MTFTESQLASMRSTAASFLPDIGTISLTGERTFNPVTGTYSVQPGAQVYSGPVRVRAQGNAEVVVNAGEEPVTQATYDVTLPWDAIGIEVDHVLILSMSSDPDLIGRPLRIRDVRVGSFNTGRRLVAEDTLG